MAARAKGVRAGAAAMARAKGGRAGWREAVREAVRAKECEQGGEERRRETARVKGEGSRVVPNGCRIATTD